MSLETCAEITRRGDPDRFLATMALPRALRARLWPLYAFNVEVARAPWITREPLIAEMRIAWWREALDDIALGRPARPHEVLTPLAGLLDAETARLLDQIAAAHLWAVARPAFADTAALMAHLDATSGALAEAAARVLQIDVPPGEIRRRGAAGGLANWFLAVPALTAAGVRPLPDGSAAAIRSLAAAARADLGGAPRPARPVLLAHWRAPAILARAVRDPAAVAAGRLGGSEFARRFSLLRASLI